MTSIKAILLGLVSGRLALSGWHFVFDYHPIGRFSWALQHGLASFVGRYQDNVLGFWLTPGIKFLIVYAIACTGFLLLRKWGMCIAAISALGIAYLGLFFSVDGYRIFAVIISSPLLWLLKEFVLLVTQKINS